MGNCLRHKNSSRVDDDDDDDNWGSLVSIHRQNEVDKDDRSTSIMEKERLLQGREVKITISKKELEQLVQKMNMQGLSLEQVLVNMVNGDHVYEIEQPRPWKPMLQSIPEVN